MDIETIRNWLRDFTEDPENKKQMSVKIYESIWHMIQIIDHELEEKKKGKKKKIYK